MKHLSESVLLFPAWIVAKGQKTAKTLCGARVKVLHCTHQIEEDCCPACIEIAQEQNNCDDPQWFDNR